MFKRASLNIYFQTSRSQSQYQVTVNVNWDFSITANCLINFDQHLKFGKLFIKKMKAKSQSVHSFLHRSKLLKQNNNNDNKKKN